MNGNLSLFETWHIQVNTRNKGHISARQNLETILSGKKTCIEIL